jgi:hypothetical protein
VIPFHALLCFGVRMVGSTFIKSWGSVGSHCPQQLVGEAAVITDGCAQLCARLSAVREPNDNKFLVSQSLHDLLHGMALCRMSKLSHTAGNHAENSIHIMKLFEMSAVELFSFTRNPTTAG